MLAMRRVKLGLTLCVVLALEGCNTQRSGRNYASSEVSSIQPNVTTESEVVQRFGNPTRFTDKSDGTRVLVWTYWETTTDGKQYIPVVGRVMAAKAAQDNSLVKTLTVTVKDGIVVGVENQEQGGARSYTPQK